MMRLAYNTAFAFFEKARRPPGPGWPPSPLPPPLDRQINPNPNPSRGGGADLEIIGLPCPCPCRRLLITYICRCRCRCLGSVWSQMLRSPELKYGWRRWDEEAAFEAYRLTQDYARRIFPFDGRKMAKARHLFLGLKNARHVETTDDDELEEMPTLPKPKPEDEARLIELDGANILQMVGYHLMSIYNPYDTVNTIDIYPHVAFFDFDKESTVGLGPPLHKITPFKEKLRFQPSVNVLYLKIVESSVGYPINIYGTVLARDQIDCRCVYLFRRDRDDPQTIISPDDMLSLIGPNRGLATTGCMLFQIDLKIKDGGTRDKYFSKCLFEHDAVCHDRHPMVRWHTSHMCTVEFVYTYVGDAVEARVEVNLCDELRNFRGKVIAWTTQDTGNHIILYDSEATYVIMTTVGNDGSLPLSRCLVAVPLDDELVLDIYILDEDKHLVLNFGQSDEARVCNLGSYELQVNVTWTAGMIRRRYFRFKKDSTNLGLQPGWWRWIPPTY